MKTTSTINKSNLSKALLLILMTGLMQISFAQNGASNLSNGLKFKNATLISGTDLQAKAKYLFSNVNDATDAVITIDSLVNGAKVTILDDDSNGLGYKDAFQPAVKAGGIIGSSYAVFKMEFFETGTNTPVMLNNVNATALDIDGNLTLKEFVKIDMGTGSLMSYMSTTTDILVSQLIPGFFAGQNILGIERGGIDTSSYNNMYTASNSGINSLTIRTGTVTTVNATTIRQYSLFMKGFLYPAITLPVKMSSFTAMLQNKSAQLGWITSSEINVSHFVVEKSVDGTNFNEVGVVFAYGSASTDASYSFSDNLGNAQSGVFYYRIRSVDIDEKSQLSETRMIRISNKTETNLQITTFPNPATNEVRITIPANWQNKKVAYQLFSANGQPVKTTERANSNQTEVINVSSLAPGMYFVKVVCDGQVAQQKIIKY